MLCFCFFSVLSDLDNVPSLCHVRNSSLKVHQESKFFESHFRNLQTLTLGLLVIDSSLTNKGPTVNDILYVILGIIGIQPFLGIRTC